MVESTPLLKLQMLFGCFPTFTRIGAILAVSQKPDFPQLHGLFPWPGGNLEWRTDP
jgi:hypothetical protein